ncbi:unnamed protein product, partial [marine sediment metagenome]
MGYLPQIEGKAWSQVVVLLKVEISIWNLTTMKWYNGTDWTASEETWLLATTTDGWLNWTYDTSEPGFWTNNTGYKIKSKATDINGSPQSPLNEKNFFFDAEIPVVRITYPEDSSGPKEVLSIEGTTDPGEEGSPISEVEIQATDSFYYLKSDDTWTTSTTWIEPDGGTLKNWTHDVSNVTFATGTVYTVNAIAYDSALNTSTDTITLHINEPPLKPT